MIDFDEYDAVGVLALPLFRFNERSRYRVEGGFEGKLRRRVYSNGTEQGFAAEDAELVMELGPFLRRVLLAGVRALANDPEFEAYASALAAGDHEKIIALERAAESVA